MADPFGIPDNIFGVVEDDFYGLVGRIALVAALVDDRVLCLLWALDDQPQDVHAGKSTSQLVDLIRKRLRARDDDLHVAGLDLMTRVTEVLGRRHAVIHSLWPNPRLESAKGWRPILPKHRVGDGTWVEWTTVTGESLKGLLGDLLSVSTELDRLANVAHGTKW